MGFFSFIITLVLLIIPFLGISKKERETYVGELGRLNPFECGFNSIFKSFSGLCVQFLNIAILFLLVDLEIALLIPFFFSVVIIEKIARIIVLLISFIIIFLFFFTVNRNNFWWIKLKGRSLKKKFFFFTSFNFRPENWKFSILSILYN